MRASDVTLHQPGRLSAVKWRKIDDAHACYTRIWIAPWWPCAANLSQWRGGSFRRRQTISAHWAPGLKKLKAISIRQPWAWLIVIRELAAGFSVSAFRILGCSPDGPYGWTLANAQRLPFKPVKGQLKFFTPKF